MLTFYVLSSSAWLLQIENYFCGEDIIRKSCCIGDFQLSFKHVFRIITPSMNLFEFYISHPD